MDLNENMAMLAQDPDEFRRRRTKAFKKIQEVIEDPPTEWDVSVDINLDASMAPIFAFCLTFFSVLADGEDVEDEFVRYILVQGLQAELTKIQNIRDHLYGMGSLEPLADSLDVELTDEERRISSMMGATQDDQEMEMEDYWSMGYITTRCPQCKRRAAWHPDKHDLICLDNCGMVGHFEERPGPNDG